ncbi:hypothetical protein [uncultured Tenacibaculum sp.]|uniref:hypothetical protein n=1 Tax=uncultured Tenacibaculum sp. TaxID=174713 RepID=UPI002631A751|nr:hypothetical protein [uncultured Tenacibaculum sp.]
MEFTEQHIEQLYRFTRQHYVEHYDVQTELVDHLANDIEQILENQPNLTFEQARDASFKKFGVFGFMNVVEEKQKQMGKQYFKLIFSFVQEWFQLPKLILTIGIFYIFFLLLDFSFAYYVFTAVYLVVFAVEIFMMYLKKRKYNKKIEVTGKRWMFEDIIISQGYGNVAFFSYYLLYFIAPEQTTDITVYGKIFVALATSLAVIIGYITMVVIPNRSEELLEKQYPEYKLSKV